MLGIEQSKIIQTNESSNIHVENLIIPSLPGKCGWQTKWQCDYLKENLAKDIKSVGIKKIYISRENATIRRVVNEDELFDYLKKEGFVKINFEKYTIKEQISIIKSAEIIVAPHGGGNTNIVFCDNQIKLIELFSPDYINVCYWALSNTLNFDYSYMISSKNIENSDILVDIDEFKKLLYS